MGIAIGVGNIPIFADMLAIAKYVCLDLVRKIIFKVDVYS